MTRSKTTRRLERPRLQDNVFLMRNKQTKISGGVPPNANNAGSKSSKSRELCLRQPVSEACAAEEGFKI